MLAAKALERKAAPARQPADFREILTVGNAESVHAGIDLDVRLEAARHRNAGCKGPGHALAGEGPGRVGVHLHALHGLLQALQGQRVHPEAVPAVFAEHELQARQLAAQVLGQGNVVAVAELHEAASLERAQEALDGEEAVLGYLHLAGDAEPVRFRLLYPDVEAFGREYARHLDGGALGPLHPGGELRGAELGQQLQHVVRLGARPALAVQILPERGTGLRQLRQRAPLLGKVAAGPHGSRKAGRAVLPVLEAHGEGFAHACARGIEGRVGTAERTHARLGRKAGVHLLQLEHGRRV